MTNIIRTTEVNKKTDQEIIENIMGYYQRACNNGVDVTSKDWYKQALTDCIALAEKFEKTLDQTIGIVSALSPRMPWIWNIANTARFYRGQKTTAYGDNVLKAQRIDKGEKPLEVLGGLKTQSFYQNISSAGLDDSVVTIDTWAIRVAMGENAGKDTVKSITPRCYNRLVRLYQETAKMIEGINAVQLQAITWEQVRIENGYDDKDWIVID